MNVGIYFDLRNPPGWATDLSRLYGFSLELCGYRVPEFELFGADPTRRYSATDRCARELRRLWADVVTPLSPLSGRYGPAT